MCHFKCTRAKINSFALSNTSPYTGHKAITMVYHGIDQHFKGCLVSSSQ